jgi:hypothetical protein
VDNLLGEALGREVAGAAGYRVRGLLDADSSRLGRAASRFDPAWLAGLPADQTAEVRPLAPFLLAAALLCLALLWSRGALPGLGFRGRRRGRAAVPSRA